jgi:DNA-binding HxlR family transcriptional regulator
MAAIFACSKVSSEQIRFMILAYGLEHAFRVLNIDEIAREIPNARREAVRAELERLAEEGLVSRFQGRYCFNREIPVELRRSIEQRVSPSGTIRVRQ